MKINRSKIGKVLKFEIYDLISESDEERNVETADSDHHYDSDSH